MLFCPHCRHQLTRNWAGDVCLMCGACFRSDQESSIASLRAYTPAGVAYIALFRAIPSYELRVQSALAVLPSMDDFVAIESHFPRLIWNADPRVRRRYGDRMATAQSVPEVHHLQENDYPITRFREQARVYLKLLFHGESRAGELFNPLEGDFGPDYSVAYSRLDGIVDAFGFSAHVSLGFCDACGLLAEMGPHSPLPGQISPACLDCRGSRQPYLKTLRAAGAFRKSTSRPPYKQRAAALPRPGLSSWENLYPKEVVESAEGIMEMLAGIENGIEPNFSSSRVTLKMGPHRHGSVHLIARKRFLLVEVGVPDRREWMNRLRSAGFEVQRRESYELEGIDFGFRLTGKLLKGSQPLLMELFQAAH